MIYELLHSEIQNNYSNVTQQGIEIDEAYNHIIIFHP